MPAGKDRPWVAIAGPCKAMEVARGVSTAVVYAAEDLELAEACARWLEDDYYFITRSDDLAGAEACSAFKNAYATASGLCDGLQLSGHPEMFNTQAGVGDLHVTAAAGRNRTYGEHVGRGEPPQQVAERMRQAGELTEGYPALETGWLLLEQMANQGALSVEDFPLLEALHNVVYLGADVAQTLRRLRLRD